MKIGLALSGGGVKGAAHIGVLKALKENGIEIGYIGGTSSGSIVSTLHALNYTTDEMLKLFKYFAKYIMKVEPKYYWTNVRNTRNLMGYGIISGENIEIAMNECAALKGIKNINDLQMPIVMPTVDIKSNKKYVFTNHQYDENFEEDVYIRNIDIGKAVRASCTYPGVFAPTIYKGHKFIDGGIIDNLPINEVKKLGAEKILAIRFSLKNETDPKNIIEVALKSVDLLFEQRSEAEVANSDYAITIDVPEATVFDIKKIEYCYNQGYIETMENMQKIKEMINGN